MLRSTSVKNDKWKPVKLLARQSLDGTVIDSSCNAKGDLVAILTTDNLNIFNNRELLDSINVAGGKKVHVTEDGNSIFVLTSDILVCYNNWGKVKWQFRKINSNSCFSLSQFGNMIALSEQNNLRFLNRFGDLQSELILDSNILSVSQSKNFIVALTEKTMNIIEDLDKINSIESKNYTAVYCSLDNIMAISDNQMASFSYGGSQLWSKDYKVTNFTFSNEGVKHVFVESSKTLICQDRNGDEIWQYNSREEFDGSISIESGGMVGIFSNQAFHVIDSKGQQAWSYQAREKIVDFSFSNHGGDVIIASKSKIHWFQNEGFLRMQIEIDLASAENLFERVSVYDQNLGSVSHDIQKAKSLQSGNFTSIKESFQFVHGVYQRLSTLQQRHVGYLDALPYFLDNLGLQGAHTDEMIPLLYPYYSLHSDLNDISHLNSSIQRAENFLTKLNRIDMNQADNLDLPLKDHKNFVKDARLGIESEINNLKSILASNQKDIVSLENEVKNLILDWLKTADLNSEPKPFLSTYQMSSEIRYSKINIINDKIDNHMAFVNYTLEQDFLVLFSNYFSANDKVNLNLNIKNKSNQKIDDIYLRIKVEGEGLGLADPLSGVIRLDHLRPDEAFSPIFSFTPINRLFTKASMVIQYQDESGRVHTNWLGEMESNFLGCYIKPFDIDSGKHDALRLKYKDSTSHSVINVESLSLKKLINISKNLPGLNLCEKKVENMRSIVYHSGQSTLDDSHYLSMIFMRAVGNEESLRTAIEIICHASDIEKSTELKEEILSYLKTNLLESNGRLV